MFSKRLKRINILKSRLDFKDVHPIHFTAKITLENRAKVLYNDAK